MKTDTQEIYETPELQELGQAEDLTLGLDSGNVPDFRGGFRYYVNDPAINAEE